MPFQELYDQMKAAYDAKEKWLTGANKRKLVELVETFDQAVAAFRIIEKVGYDDLAFYKCLRLAETPAQGLELYALAHSTARFEALLEKFGPEYYSFSDWLAGIVKVSAHTHFQLREWIVKTAIEKATTVEELIAIYMALPDTHSRRYLDDNVKAKLKAAELIASRISSLEDLEPYLERYQNRNHRLLGDVLSFMKKTP